MLSAGGGQEVRCMEKEKLESLLIDYLDNILSKEAKEKVDGMLAENEEARKLLQELKVITGALDNSQPLQPSASMHRRFEESLANEVVLESKSKQIFMIPTMYRVAATVGLILVSVGIAYWINKNRQQADELSQLKTEMEATKKMLMAMLDNKQSASQRVQGATIAYTIGKADDEVVNALAKALNEDKNTNVRLAALEALAKFYQEENVRQLLIKSLSIQNDEVVQIALIQVLVQMKEKGIVKELEKITRDTEVLKAVKDEAFTGILKLS